MYGFADSWEVKLSIKIKSDQFTSSTCHLYLFTMVAMDLSSILDTIVQKSPCVKHARGALLSS